MTTVFHARLYGRFTKIKSKQILIEQINFIEQIKAPIFLEAVLAIDMSEPQSNLGEIDNPSILKDDFS